MYLCFINVICYQCDIITEVDGSWTWDGRKEKWEKGEGSKRKGEKLKDIEHK